MPKKTSDLLNRARSIRTGAAAGRELADRIAGYDEKLESKQMKKYTASTVVLITAVLICAVIAVQVLSKGYVNIFGYSVFRVVTGSMEPTLEIGTVLVTKSTDISTVKVGDIVCFKSEEPDNFGMIITHRVMNIRTDAYGIVQLETKGDANPVSDAYRVRKDNLIGKVISYHGKGSIFTNILSFMTGKVGFLACIVFPILLTAGFILKAVVKNLRRDMTAALKELNSIEHDPLDDPLPGYKYLTVRDYKEIYSSLKREMIRELNAAGYYVDPEKLRQNREKQKQLRQQQQQQRKQ